MHNGVGFKATYLKSMSAKLANIDTYVSMRDLGCKLKAQQLIKMKYLIRKVKLYFAHNLTEFIGTKGYVLYRKMI